MEVNWGSQQRRGMDRWTEGLHLAVKEKIKFTLGAGRWRVHVSRYLVLDSEIRLTLQIFLLTFLDRENKAYSLQQIWEI